MAGISGFFGRSRGPEKGHFGPPQTPPNPEIPLNPEIPRNPVFRGLGGYFVKFDQNPEIGQNRGPGTPMTLFGDRGVPPYPRIGTRGFRGGYPEIPPQTPEFDVFRVRNPYPHREMVKKGLFGGSSLGKLLIKRPFSRKRVPDPQFRVFRGLGGLFGPPKEVKTHPTRSKGPRSRGASSGCLVPSPAVASEPGVPRSLTGGFYC